MSQPGPLSAPADGYIQNHFSHKQLQLSPGAESHCNKETLIRQTLIHTKTKIIIRKGSHIHFNYDNYLKGSVTCNEKVPDKYNQ